MMRANVNDLKMHGSDVLQHCPDVVDEDVLHRYMLTFIRTFTGEYIANAIDEDYRKHKNKDKDERPNYGNN